MYTQVIISAKVKTKKEATLLLPLFLPVNSNNQSSAHSIALALLPARCFAIAQQDSSWQEKTQIYFSIPGTVILTKEGPCLKEQLN